MAAGRARRDLATFAMLLLAVILAVVMPGNGPAYLLAVGALVARSVGFRSEWLPALRAGAALGIGVVFTAADILAGADWGGDFWMDVRPTPYTALALLFQFVTLWLVLRKVTPRPSAWLCIWIVVILTMVAFELAGPSHVWKDCDTTMMITYALLCLTLISGFMVLSRGDRSCGWAAVALSLVLTWYVWMNVDGTSYFGFWRCHVT